MRYEEFKNAVIESAKAQGIEEYELYYVSDDSIGVEILMHEVDSYSTDASAGICFRCKVGDRMGYASTELFEKEEAERIVIAAVENAKTIDSEDVTFIYPAGDTYENMEPVVTTEPTAKELIDTAMAMHEATLAKDGRIIPSSSSFAYYGGGTVALCNSKGLDLTYSGNSTIAGSVAVAADGEEMYNGVYYREIDFKDIDVETFASKAAEKALSTVGSDTVETGTYNIIYSTDTMSSILQTYCDAFSAEDVLKGISLLAGKLEEKIAADIVTLVDDPFCKETLNRRPFDGEGVATHRKTVIEAGTLKTYLHNLTTANKMGVKPTGNGRKASYASSVSILPYNLYIERGDAGTKEDMFKAIGTGIYVTALNGMHAGANPITGDFSLAAEGFAIENGEKGRPVKNFTVSGNFYELLKNIKSIGSDLEFMPSRGGCCFGSPSVLVADVPVAGK